MGKKNFEICKWMDEIVVEMDKMVIVEFFKWKYNGVLVGNGWNCLKNNVEFGVDYYNWIGILKLNMFDNKLNEM